MGHAKGTTLLHLREYVQERHDARTWEEVVSRLPAEDREVLEGVILVGGWYAVGVWNRALRSYLKHNWANREEGMRHLAGFIAECDLNQLYKLILRASSPELLLRRTSSLWGRYFDTGELQAHQRADRHWTLELIAPTGDDDAPDRFTCGPGIEAWIANGLRLTGAEGEVRHVKCRFGSSQCEYEVRW